MTTNMFSPIYQRIKLPYMRNFHYVDVFQGGKRFQGNLLAPAKQVLES